MTPTQVEQLRIRLVQVAESLAALAQAAESLATEMQTARRETRSPASRVER